MDRTHSVAELVERLRSGGAGAHDAALALGLLLEREASGFGDGVRAELVPVIGEELAAHRLSKSEAKLALDALLLYLRDTARPLPMAAWALTKSADPAIVSPLIALLDRTLDSREDEALAYQALLGIINIGVASNYREAALEAVRRAERRGSGEVRDTAASYLRLQSGADR